MKTLPFSGNKVTVLMVALLLAPSVAMAAETDIANSPMSSAADANVKPNILFILDDSTSMTWDYMPDNVNSNSNKRCFGYHGYNRIFYNPNYTYPVPVNASGTPLAIPSFTSAWTDGYKQTGSKDLSNLSNLSVGTVKANPSCNNNCTTTKYYYSTFTSTQTLDCTDSKYSITTILPEAQKQNYANWYSFYRTRELFMRAGAGLAFVNLSDNYRVGFTTINEGRTDASFDELSESDVSSCSDNTCKFSLHVRPFDSTQKQSFFRRLYKASASLTGTTQYTPLRGALMKGGQYFANKLSSQTAPDGQNYDPLQYSCQQNFVILSTDGFWNTDRETSSYGPYQLDRSNDVANQDSGTSVARPYRDDFKSKSGTGCAGVVGGSGKSATLADVAMYYYKTDLRTSDLGNCTGALGSDVCENNMPGASEDNATHQHVTLFTLGLGVDGLLQYADDYKQGGSSGYNAILNGTKPWPDPISSGCSQEPRIDDLWHAAVNGRGTYFSAKNPQSLTTGLNKALSAINARNGASAAAATSNLELVAGDNFVYVALYRTVKWDGDLKAFAIDPQTGAIDSTALWSAQEKLDTQVGSAGTGDGRTIYMFSGTTSSKLRPFTYDDLTTEGKSGFFDSMCGASPKLSQCSSLTTTQQGMASGVNLVNYLRGQNTYEDQASNTDRLYRDREHTLGDVINAVPVYLKKPPFRYADFGYSEFVTANANRVATVFVAANDGMLHAFNADTGEERWAFVPTSVLNKLYKLADTSYSQNHEYFVDGSPTVADICTANCGTASATWKTILIGGLNKGGRAYYALDVTDPTAPKGLWEFANDNLGLTFGNPVVAKNKAGTWVVMFSSGYNNLSPGDGNGHVFVVNAATGTLIDTISTLENSNPVGSTTTPSGLARINAWVESDLDNTAKRVYGGDLLGNVWRFDFDNNYPPTGKDAVKLAELRVDGKSQPVTTKPELAKVNNLYDVVFVGTGRYLGTPDLSNVEQQSIYALKDTLASTGLGDVRQGTQLVEQTLTDKTNSAGRVVRTASQNTVNWATKDGWYIDLNPGDLSPGERVNTEMQQQFNILTVATNVPDPNACNVGGYGYLYNVDINTGGGLSTAPEQGLQVGVRLSTNALVAGIKVVRLTTGKTVAIVTDTTGTVTVEDIPSPTGSAAGAVKRTMWREIFD